jgi:hypothetical protein
MEPGAASCPVPASFASPIRYGFLLPDQGSVNRLINRKIKIKIFCGADDLGGSTSLLAMVVIASDLPGIVHLLVAPTDAKVLVDTIVQ